METQTETARHLGLWKATGIGVGAIVGGGVLALAGLAFSNAGPAVLVVFLANGIIAYLTALSFAEMASHFPENGGAYAFTKKLLNVRAAFATGWILWFASIAAGALYALGFSAYMIAAIDALWRLGGGAAPAWLASRWMTIGLSVSAVLVYTALLTRQKGGSGQWETIGKVVLFVLIILGGAWVFLREPWSQTTRTLTPFFGQGMGGILTAMGGTFITLQGFDLIAAVAGEVKEPERNVPRAMYLSLAIALLIYVPLLFLIATVGVPQGQSLTQFSAAHADTLVAEAVRNFLGEPGFWLVTIAAILSMLSALYANMLVASRIALAMSQDRTLPRFLASARGQSGHPLRAIAVSALVIVIFVVAWPNVSVAGAAASLIFLLSFALTHITAILVRKRVGRRPGSLRFPLVPVLGLLSCGSLAFFQGASMPSAGSIASLWLTLGFALYFTMFSDRAEVIDARTQASDPQLAKLRGRSPLVLVPIANPERAQIMVQVAHSLAPPHVGRVLLLCVVRNEGAVKSEQEPRELLACQEVLREALGDSLRRGVRPEALVTIASDPWSEIIRVAHMHRCESVVLGLSELGGGTGHSPLETMIADLTCDVVVIGTPPDWEPSQLQRVLVPVGGAGRHDELRARLLASLYRSGGARQVQFLRILPPDTPPAAVARHERNLRLQAAEEVPGNPLIEIALHADPAAAIAERATDCDLLILGMQRRNTPRLISPLAHKIYKAAGGAVIFISHH